MAMSANVSNLIIVATVLAIVTAIILYLYRAKKRGETCIGCHYAGQCSGGSGNLSGNDYLRDGAGGCSCGCGASADEILAQIKLSGEKM